MIVWASLRPFLLLLTLLIAPAAWAQTGRVALVIGNGAYRDPVPALANPPRDARAIAEALTQLGFETKLVVDGTVAAMREGVAWLGTAAVGKEAAVLYYAGHAAEVGGRNLLFPISIGIGRGGERLLQEALPFDEVSAALAGRAQTTLIFLDSCRDNPLTGLTVLAPTVRRSAPAGDVVTRSVGVGLASVSSTAGMLIAFATAPGQVALDGEGGHSPFTAALLRHIATPDLEVREMLSRVRRSVREATGGRQIPWDNSSLETRFVFRAALGLSVTLAPTRRTVDDAAAVGIPSPPGFDRLQFRRPADARLARLVGSWTSGMRRWSNQPMSRAVRLLVLDVNEAERTATVLLGRSGPNPQNLNPDEPAGWSGALARLAPDGGLEWTTRSGLHFRFALIGPDSLIGQFSTPADSPRYPNHTWRIRLERLE